MTGGADQAPGGLQATNAVVTGASSGIGRAIALDLAGRGARVALMARSAARLHAVAEEIARTGGDAEVVAADVTDAAAVHDAVTREQARFGPPHLAVHCAGTATVLGPLWESDLDAWWGEVAGHAKGGASLAHAVLPGMVARGEGRVVFTYGNLGDLGEGHWSADACGKAALLRLTEHLDAEAAPHGVRVLAIHPGLVETPMTQALAGSDDAQRWLPRAEAWPQRWGTAAAAAALVASIAAGRLDAFGGRLVGAWEQLDRQEPHGDTRTLRVQAP